MVPVRDDPFATEAGQNTRKKRYVLMAATYLYAAKITKSPDAVSGQETAGFRYE